MTFDKAVAHADGMKLVPLDKPMIVHKEHGVVKLSDLPAKMEITDGSIKEKHHFLDVIADWEGTLDFKNIETLFLQQRYADLPPPLLSMKGQHQAPYTMQLIILPKPGGKHDIIKRIKLQDDDKLTHATIISMCHGTPLEIDLRGKFREGSRGFQHMLQSMGGFQVKTVLIRKG
ncbi:unnamed protein product [Effrenium voratum]|uniref:Uncharacterized protein n=1 Tax=Effrenium voratum TaxID=2562239 RepID=A0AA36NKM0_9DINO|nr:unnamed protein product [Effrenium voratum]